MKKIQHEAAEQETLFEWAALQHGKYPELDMLFHVPNGGYRDSKEGANLKLQGVKAGVPDILLLVARGEYHGMAIEMKAGKNRPTKDQLRWLANLTNEGYYVTVCYSMEEAAEKIIKYLEMGKYNELR
ncbi:MAG: VRR-NUC domain-containing protein [Acutalibacteraceae bacterium]